MAGAGIVGPVSMTGRVAVCADAVPASKPSAARPAAKYLCPMGPSSPGIRCARRIDCIDGRGGTS
jgi:hypothetical protein